MRHALLLAAIAGAGFSVAAVEMPAVFSNDMVLQRGRTVPVWGTAEQGEKVTVSFAGQQVAADVKADGRWEVKLQPMEANPVGETLTVKGNNELKFTDVLVGDVWLCAGQSNMQFGLRHISGGPEIVAASENPQIRLLQIPCVWSRTPQTSVKAHWVPCTPKTVGGFAAVGYLVGREIQKTIKVPVGLINISWGGCRVESMTSHESFRAAGVSAELSDSIDKQVADMNAKQDAELRKDKQRLSTALYNAMVHPLSPFAVKGMLWYQGEDNHYEGAAYTEKLRALAHSWRTAFQDGNMPIYVVQIPPWQYGKENPVELPAFWAAQQRFAQADRNAGFITTTDCGDPADIHPRDKMPLSMRLANLILYKTYGIGDSSVFAPTFRDMKAANGKLIVDFDRANGLTTRDGKSVSHLAVAGADGEFHPAAGTIENGQLVVCCDAVKEPVRLRFGWDKLANPNLVNRAGVPVAPFDTAVETR